MEKVKFTLAIDKELNEELENYKWNNRIKSKTQVIVELLKKALENK